MKYVRIGGASVNQTPLDWEGNARRIIAILDEAQERGIAIICLPELCTTGYGCEDMFLSPHLHQKAQDVLFRVIWETKFEGTYAIGLPVVYENSVYNCMAVVNRGRLCGLSAKQNLAKDGLHYEPRWFQPWVKGCAGSVKLGSLNYGGSSVSKISIGDLVFEGSGIRFGFEICEDAWVAERTGSHLARKGVDVIFSPAASHFAFGKQQIRRGFVSEGSRAFGCAYVYANLLGNESGRVVFDGSTFIASNGKVLQEGDCFSFKDHNIIEADIHLDTLRIGRLSREGFKGGCEKGPITQRVGKIKTLGPADVNSSTQESQDLTKNEEFENAIALGLFDYLRKSKTQGYVISLSGGADSAAAAVLVNSMVRLAKAELGDVGLKNRLSHINKEISVTNLLTTVYQGTRNSSLVTDKAATAVAKGVGATHLEVSVDGLVEGYKAIVGNALGVDWDWDTHDMPLQNIQARVRSPLAWMIANVENKILLATSNRSEAALGYATMDGDTSGGLSPLAGIDKNYLLSWLRYMEENIPELSYINQQRPTAELRPLEEGQTDEEDLMPYEVLDQIERLMVKDKQGPYEIYHWLDHHTEHDPANLRTWVTRFFRLWSRNQWKRERYAPSFHLDEANLDPKSWCRFPILSGGFEEELAQLKKETDDD